jgi:L-Ala-D/L-Glu epimerase
MSVVTEPVPDGTFFGRSAGFVVGATDISVLDDANLGFPTEAGVAPAGGEGLVFGFSFVGSLRNVTGTADGLASHKGALLGVAVAAIPVPSLFAERNEHELYVRTVAQCTRETADKVRSPDGLAPTVFTVIITSRRVHLTKRHPLTISRGTITGSTNLIVTVIHDGFSGSGEMAPSDVTGDTPESAELDLGEWAEALEDLSPDEFQRIDAALAHVGASDRGAVRAALDMACHDWWGRSLNQPVWRLLGLDNTRIAPTSLTIGINPPDVIRTVVPEILNRTRALYLKVKLGQSAGIDADMAMFAAVQESAATTDVPTQWRVDANGGWDVPSAQMMIGWLADRGVLSVEQPLAQGNEEGLPFIYRTTTVPIFADESVRVASDVADLSDRVHGVNLKLMKCGGIREGLRIIHTARAHGLKVMIGCMGESSLAISAGAQIAPLVDVVDLDSHLNLVDDPFVGASYVHGRVIPTDAPGLGVEVRPS